MKNTTCCYKFFLTVIVLIILGIVGYISLNFADKLFELANGVNKNNTFHILFVYVLFLFFVAFVVKALFESAKYFSKLDCLNEVVDENSKEEIEIIKKYCDTLVEL
ncbi:hypothetical protein [uncultured Treponema sp.]|uniref:hypothetical protein n=1 Tax=uncultured Treponema sp. TaxID=162155 RepID=UPI0025EAFF29|nr:hypothetical protein [uncultured Treponema sp.]